MLSRELRERLSVVVRDCSGRASEPFICVRSSAVAYATPLRAPVKGAESVSGRYRHGAVAKGPSVAAFTEAGARDGGTTVKDNPKLVYHSYVELDVPVWCVHPEPSVLLL